MCDKCFSLDVLAFCAINREIYFMPKIISMKKFKNDSTSPVGIYGKWELLYQWNIAEVCNVV